MNSDEFREKVRRTVDQAIKDKRDLDGLVDVLKKILYYEISSFSDKIKTHEPPDVALIAYKGRHYYKKGYEKRGLDLDEAINKELEGYKNTVEPLEPTTPPPSTITAEPAGETPKEPPETIQTVSNDTIL